MKERTLRLQNEGEIPERTFHRHRQAIADIFGVDILCNRYDGNTYFIDNDDALKEPSFSSWLFNGMAIDNQLMGNKDISDRIIFEETPVGSEFLSPIIEAMTKNSFINIAYRRFRNSETGEREMKLYAIKQSGRRWYLLAGMSNSDVKVVYALDRVEGVRLTDKTFPPRKMIDVTTYFDDVIGVNVDDDYDYERVELRVYGGQRDYIDSLPLHNSQRIKVRFKGYTDCEFTLRPEYEFQRSILSLGPDAEVISPLWLRDELRWLAEETLRRYT